jgi:hypothetical protein
MMIRCLVSIGQVSDISILREPQAQDEAFNEDITHKGNVTQGGLALAALLGVQPNPTT